MTKITQSYLTVSPAYGRDYKSRREAFADFQSGKDFTMESFALTAEGCGRYCSIRDFAPGTKVNIRYNRMRSVGTFAVPHTVNA